MEPPKSPSKPPLITPSASPSPSRHSYRMSDSAPPSKRQRLFSTPRRTMPEASSSSVSRPPTPANLEKAREASVMRLLDVWGRLAERYTRRIDEDDIVDIRTGEITKDNGFLRNFRKVDFGAIAAATASDATADDSSDAPEEDEEDEYDLDELDAFAEENTETYESQGGELDAEDVGRLMRPATSLGPADAEDLREFMDAERQRKELCGSDVEADEDDGYLSAEGAQSDSTSEYESRNGLEEEDPFVLEDAEEDGPHKADEEEREEVDLEEESRAVSDLSIPLDLTSEDELDNWDMGEASIVRPVIKNERVEDDNDSDIEIIAVAASSILLSKAPEAHSHVQKTPNKSHPHFQKPFHQLHTPPQSQSSSHPSATPMSDIFADLSTGSPPRAPSSNYPAKFNSSKSNAATDRTPVPKLDLTQFSKPPGKRVFSLAKSPKLLPFVLLTPRKGFNSQTAASVSASAVHVHSQSPELEPPEHHNPTPSKDLKGKGKAKESTDIITSERSKPQTQNPSKPVARGKQRGRPGNRTQKELHDDSDAPITITSSPSPSQAPPSVLSKEDEDIAFFTNAPSKPQKSNPKKSSRSQGETSFTAPLGGAKISRPQQSNSLAPEPLPLPRKRKRALSDAMPEFSDGLTQETMVEKRNSPVKFDLSSNHASTSLLVHDDRSRVSKPKKPSPSRRRRTRSESESGTESELHSSGCEDVYCSHRSRSCIYEYPAPQPHYSYPHAPYTHTHRLPQSYPPIPDPRAQFIITQAMQQLSALVGAPWIPPQPYMDDSIPRTPSHHHHGGRPSNGSFITPTHHPHPYPYAYDPNLSHATLPPDSPDVDSSPDKSSSGHRKSLVRRSRSRGRRVSFMVEEDRLDEMVIHSSPPGARPLKAVSQKELRGDHGRGDEWSKKSKGKRKETSPDRTYQSADDVESDMDRSARVYVRAQTPGPSSGPSGSKAGHVRPSSSNQNERL